MGKAFSSLPPTATEAAKEIFGQNGINDINTVFHKLSSRPGSNGKNIDRETFEQYFSYPGPLKDQIFEIFDHDHDGFIDRDEFLRGLAMCCDGTIDEKLEFCFNMFDITQDGYVDRDELMQCLVSTACASLCLMDAMSSAGDTRTSSSSKENEDDIVQDVSRMVDDAFASCDVDKNGKLSLNEFKGWMLQTPEIAGIIYSVFEARKLISVEEVTSELEEERNIETDQNKLNSLKFMVWACNTIESENKQYEKEIQSLEDKIEAASQELRTKQSAEAKEMK